MPIILTGDDLTARFDDRTLSQLASDTGAPIAVADIPTDDHIIQNIEDAEGQVLAFLAKGGRITPANIEALKTLATGGDATATVQFSYLKRIVADLAMFHMLQRRPSVNSKLFEQMKLIRDEHLKALSSGESLLALDPATEQASRANADGVSYQDLVQNNSVRIRSHRYFCNPPLPRGRQ